MPDLDIRRWPEETLINRSSVAQAREREGFTCEQWMDPPGSRWLDFVHQTDERVIVHEGKIEFEVEGARALLGPGDEVFIPAGSRHSVWNRGSSTARWFYGYKNR